MKKLLFTTTALALFAPMAAQAADQTEPSSEIIVTGTRQTGMKAADSAAPIQLIGTQAFQSVGQQDLTQVLAQTLPSLNFQGFGGDTANLTLSAALRGINPNDTLVLINGKRRHTTANLAVLGGSPYSGSATTDLSFVPTNAIGRIEVLQDGAAAQYGSDAIAGVVNIMLKSADHGGSFTATGGSNYENGGKTAATALNLGFKLGDKGFVNVTGEYKFHDYTSHGNYDRRFFYSDGSLKTSILNSTQINGLKSFAGYPNVNNINGDARYSIYNLSFNAGYDVGSDAQVYAFGTYGNRNAKAYENYRSPDRVSGTTSTGTTVYPLSSGFQPQENIREEDFSLTTGIKGKAAQWNYDLSLTYGKDAVALYTINSANPTLYSMAQSASATALTGLQRNFYDGQLSNSEWVGNIDISRDFDLGMSKPLTLAFGGEYRQGNYSISQGEYASYIYGGAQSYPGFAPTDAGSYGRTSYAGYVDVAADPIEHLHVDVAGRYEHYSDFGSTVAGKFNARYDFSEKLGIRGTVSNGFRAPTLAEAYYSSVNVGPGSTFGQLPPNSAAAQTLGFAKLKAEKSTNFSVGFVAHPLPKLQITVDAYQIKIRDRIVPSGDIFGTLGTTVVSQAVVDALTSRGVSLADASSYAGIDIFTNGVDTRTRGVEATASYSSDFGEMGKVDWSLGANYNKTEITKVNPLPAAVYNAAAGQTDLLTQTAKDALTTATPRVKLIAGALWNIGKFSVNLRETLYGTTSQHISTDGTGNCAGGDTNTCRLMKIGTTFITDLNVGYKFTPKIRFDLGANNLFDKQAPTMPTINKGTTSERPLANNVYNAPLSFTPWGINGGYYYARVTVNF
ncbi:TonB-dependent receptor plug domain-containing protein [Novosphingobium sediminicola]|uniref:Iron complex outermembrane receptor protein n=1 Tax=Novosphingobium sediminicola TaxID=563162 RepID=A0A7W6CLS2_9SPHN|nr:TonB-dependent receptor [Novosphingobium sediminicola]MBB3955311.1 iron complex outermembrane receptor protein [Novosphingobium sediminicola]